jgi:hypothetical protein
MSTTDGARSAEEQLMTQLRAVAAEADRVPPDVFAAARAAYALRTLDDELAELVADSLESAAGVRGELAARLLSFEAPSVSVEIEVSAVAGRRRIVGQVTGVSGEVTIESATASVRVPVDDLGRFVADVAAGLVRLRCTAVDGSRVATSWQSI